MLFGRERHVEVVDLLARGGATETVMNGTTGVLVDDASAPAFADGITRAISASFDRAAIRQNAERFSRERFVDEISGAMTSLLESR